MITSVAALAFTVVTSVVAGFQLGLALGAPWAHTRWVAAFPEHFLR